MRETTLLPLIKFQEISRDQPVFRHVTDENQRKNKHVESCLVRRLDGGSSPPISPEKRLLARQRPFFVEKTSFPLGAVAPSSSARRMYFIDNENYRKSAYVLWYTGTLSFSLNIKEIYSAPERTMRGLIRLAGDFENCLESHVQ